MTDKDNEQKYLEISDRSGAKLYVDIVYGKG